MKFILNLLVVSNLLFSIIAHATHYTLSYDNKPITVSSWEEISIKWHGGHAKLLRPIAYAHRQGLVVGGHVHMGLAEFGVPNAEVNVTAVNPIPQQTIDKIHHLPKGRKPIIGVYVHQTKDVRTYRFVDMQGHTSIVHATPVHPFYVNNLHTYVPISKVTDTMQLVGKNNEIIHLICPKGKHQRCGKPYHQGRITTVYNLEVHQKHFYRVGNNAIKVHNGPTCGWNIANIDDIKEPIKNPRILTSEGQWVTDNPDYYSVKTYNSATSEEFKQQIAGFDLLGFNDKQLLYFNSDTRFAASNANFDYNQGLLDHVAAVVYRKQEPITVAILQPLNNDILIIERMYKNPKYLINPATPGNTKGTGILAVYDAIQSGRKMYPGATKISSHASSMYTAVINDRLGFRVATVNEAHMLRELDD